MSKTKTLNLQWGNWSLFLIIAIIALLIAFIPPSSDFRIRLCGFIFQLYGITSVMWGIIQARKLLGKKSIFIQLRDQLVRLFRSQSPRTYTRTITGQASIAASGSTAIWIKDGQNITIERRIEILESNLELLNTRHGAYWATNDKFTNDLSKRLIVEQQTREKSENELKQLIENLQLGGIQLSVASVIGLILGLIFLTFPQEILYQYNLFSNERSISNTTLMPQRIVSSTSVPMFSCFLINSEHAEQSRVLRLKLPVISTVSSHTELLMLINNPNTRFQDSLHGKRK